MHFPIELQMLWSGRVCLPEKDMDSDTKVIHALNQFIHKDERVHCSLLSTGDGTMIAIKK